MKKFILFAIMAFTLCLPCVAQEVAKNSNTTTVVRKGNVFKSNRASDGRQSAKEEKTNWEYEDAKGNTYPIYLSSSGKAFIKKISKKTGKEYRQYLPEVGRKINPQAYESRK